MREPAAYEHVAIPIELVEAFCKRNHIARLFLFGSVLREDFHSASDVDVLIEFERDQTPGLAFFRMQRELSEIFGRPVDLNTPAMLHPSFRSRILATARQCYGHH